MRNRIVEQDMQFITEAKLPWDRFADKTVLISGAAGFLPSYMVETFAYLNETRNLNIQVVALVRSLAKAQKRFAHLKGRPDILLMKQDVCKRFAMDEKINFIIHAASFAKPKVFKANPVATILPNTVGTINLLELAVEHQVEGFLFFSTTGVYGFVADEDYPIREDCFGGLNSMDLSSCYLESKRMGENMCACWHAQYSVPIKVVRPAITYGPGLDLSGGRSFEDFISCIVQNRDITLHSDGSAIRNFCYIADATLGFFIVILNGKNGEAYNVATDHEISIKDLAYQLVKDVFPERNLRVKHEYDHSEQSIRMNYHRTTVNITKAKALGWTLSFPIEEGFRRVVASIESERYTGEAFK